MSVGWIGGRARYPGGSSWQDRRVESLEFDASIRGRESPVDSGLDLGRGSGVHGRKEGLAQQGDDLAMERAVFGGSDAARESWNSTSPRGSETLTVPESPFARTAQCA
jgi:hypothetical protein